MACFLLISCERMTLVAASADFDMKKRVFMNKLSLITKIALFSMVFAGVDVLAVGAPAGVNIVNVATATYTPPGPPGTPPVDVTSNTSSLKVDEILDVTVIVNDSANVSANSPATDKALSFKVTNTGNGPEAFALTFNNALLGDQFNPGNTRLYLDVNADGNFDPSDVLYVAGVNDPLLTADGFTNVFVVSDIGSGLANNDIGLVRLKAEAITAQTTVGSDLPGTSFAGLGQNGGDAVVGSTKAEANNKNGYVITQVAATLVKTASVVDPFGGSKLLPKSVITYTLTFDVAGSGTIQDLVIADNIPVNTTYSPASITLDGIAQTDADDVPVDVSQFINTLTKSIKVDIGDVVAPATHIVTFKVIVD